MPHERKERLQPSADFELILARHAQYSMDEEHPETLGHLTETGKQQAKDLGDRVFEAAKQMGGNVDISFIASTQVYDSPAFPDFQESGRRAEETALEAMDQIMERIEHEGRPFRVLSPVPEQTPDIPYNQRLIEQNIWYVPTNPQGEENANPFEYIRALKEQHGDNWKEVYLRGTDAPTHEIAERIGGETSQVLSHRVMGVIRDVAELARLHAERDPSRKMLFVLVAHDGVVRTVVQNELGVGEDAYDQLLAHAESVPVHIENGVTTTEFNGKSYHAPIETEAS